MSDRELTVQIVVRLTPAMLASLRRISEDEDRTVAQTVRLLVRRYVADATPPTAEGEK